MGFTPKDWDIATSALPQTVKGLFPHTFDTGIKHGTITVVRNHTHYEVTTYRVDGIYEDNRRPSSVTFTARIEDDLSRRDFTMNAVAYNPAVGFVDPWGGKIDIGKKIIRCVGDPINRFGEDALRMLRALRFAAQLGFAIETATLQAVSHCNHTLAAISAERIKEELTRLLVSPYPENALYLSSLGLMPHVLFGRSYGGDLPVVTEQLKKCPAVIRLRAALFFAWAGNDALLLLRDLRFDNKTARDISVLINYLPFPVPQNRYEIKKIMSLITPGLADDLFTLQQNQTNREILRDILASGECFTLRDLAVKGDDLMEMGFKPGAGLGMVLAELLEAVMRDPSLNRHSVLSRIISPPRT
jgi:tRNA nucleotidyltransferase (CCA-adding enzyme)